MQGYVLGLIDHSHAPAADLFDDAVVGDDLADQLVLSHLAGMLRGYLEKGQLSVSTTDRDRND